MKALKEIDALTCLDRDSYLRHYKLCFYCWSKPVDGYINGRTPVCEECYDINHQ